MKIGVNNIDSTHGAMELTSQLRYLDNNLIGLILMNIRNSEV